MIEDTYKQLFHDTVAPIAILDAEFRFVDVSDVTSAWWATAATI